MLSILQRTFTGEGWVRALSVYSAVLASGPAVGQSLGGVLVSADLFGTGWRPVFLVNVPIGVLMLLLAPRVIPRDRPGDPGRRRGLDLAGLVGARRGGDPTRCRWCSGSRRAGRCGAGSASG